VATLLSPANHVLAVEPAERSAANPATCHLNIQGGPVEVLTLVDDKGNCKEIQRPGASVSLAPGRYRLDHISLKGGCECHVHPITDDSWFTLAPDKSHDLRLGIPLKPEVAVTRHGRIVELSYALRGVGGYEYICSDRSNRPRFTVYKGDRMIGSDDFQYG